MQRSSEWIWWPALSAPKGLWGWLHSGLTVITDSVVWAATTLYQGISYSHLGYSMTASREPFDRLAKHDLKSGWHEHSAWRVSRCL